MAELATLARPYAEAMFEVASKFNATAVAAELDALAQVAADPQLRRFAEAPKASAEQVFALITSVAQTTLSEASKNLLRTVIDNGRLSVMPEIAAQFRLLANGDSGISDAIVYSAFPIEPGLLAELTVSLEKRFGRRLATRVEIDPELIGGVRVVVGDEVLDTSVRARLQQMRAALTA